MIKRCRVCFIVFDLISLFFRWNNDRLYLLPLILAVMITIYGFAHTRKLHIKEYQIPIAGNSRKVHMKIVLLSDFMLVRMWI